MKIFGGAFKQFFPWIKETFNIPVENVIEAANLVCTGAKLQSGPEWAFEYSEATRERAAVRATKCAWWERYKENKVRPEFIPCLPTCDVEIGEGVKAVNPKITHKLTKARPRGDPYCEWVFEFKDD